MRNLRHHHAPQPRFGDLCWRMTYVPHRAASRLAGSAPSGNSPHVLTDWLELPRAGSLPLSLQSVNAWLTPAFTPRWSPSGDGVARRPQRRRFEDPPQQCFKKGDICCSTALANVAAAPAPRVHAMSLPLDLRSPAAAADATGALIVHDRWVMTDDVSASRTDSRSAKECRGRVNTHARGAGGT